MALSASSELENYSELPEEHRAAPRHACKLEVCFERSPAGRSPCPAILRDISTGGIGLVVSDAIPRGTVVTIQLSRDGEGILFRKAFRIKYARNEAAGGWAVGGSFEKHLTKKEMKQLLHEAAEE